MKVVTSTECGGRVRPYIVWQTVEAESPGMGSTSIDYKPQKQRRCFICQKQPIQIYKCYVTTRD